MSTAGRPRSGWRDGQGQPHVVNTMGAGLGGADGHIEALQSVASALM